MVQLPEVAFAEADPRVVLFQYYHHKVFLQYGPMRLLELEYLADIVTSLMSAYTTHERNFRQIAMNRLRHEFNLEFKLLCDECGRFHYQDEISAPER